MQATPRIHHITAIVRDPQINLDFYRGVLGMRLVKQTVNFDSSSVYHFYYGDEAARPGFILTFFPYPTARSGERGGGQVGRIAFRIPQGSLSYWQERLNKHGINWSMDTMLGQKAIFFDDPDNLALAFIEVEEEAESNALLGFAGTVLHSVQPQDTFTLLHKDFGLELLQETEGSYLLQTVGEEAHLIEISKTVHPLGRITVGTVHHIAWSVPDDVAHLAAHRYFAQQGQEVTDIRDRKYFKAFYFREAGRILFEVATDTPGFTIDESIEELGQSLKLPAQYEAQRAAFEADLPVIELKEFTDDFL